MSHTRIFRVDGKPIDFERMRADLDLSTLELWQALSAAEEFYYLPQKVKTCGFALLTYWNKGSTSEERVQAIRNLSQYYVADNEESARVLNPYLETAQERLYPVCVSCSK